MKIISRPFILFVLIIISVCLFISCESGKGNDTGASILTDAGLTDGTSFETPEEITINVGGNGYINYSVIRPENIDTQSSTAKGASKIFVEMQSLFGSLAKIDTDFLKSGDEHDSSTFEILVGFTNHNETVIASEGCNYGEYQIIVVGNKIVILGYSDDNITAAVNVFIKILKNNYDQASNSVTIKTSELQIKNQTDSQLAALPVYETGTFSACYDAGMRIEGSVCNEIIVKNTTSEEYDEYIDKLEDNGYTLNTSNDIEKNKFATLTNSTYTVTTGYYDYETSARILIEPLAPTSGLEAETTYTSVTTSLLTMLGVSYPSSSSKYGLVTNGLCILIRLEDGRFIVVDGGHNEASNAALFVNTIKEQSKDYTTTPTVAAWIATHAHGDHIGMLTRQYITLKTANIRIERFFFNCMSDIEYKRMLSEGSGENESEEKTTRSAYFGLISIMMSNFSSEIYKPHVGQVYRFANSSIEMLYTLESYAPNICGTMNTSSVIAKITITDSKTGKETVYMSTGDTTYIGMDIARKMFGDYLKSDIVQVSHHGFSSGTGADAYMRAAYSKMNAALILLPNGHMNSSTEALSNFPYTKQLFDNPEFKECYIAGKVGEYITVKLPYEYGKGCISGTLENQLKP